MKRLTADEEGILPLITVKCSAGPLQIVSYPHRTSPSERKRVSNSIGTAILQLRGGSEEEEKQNVIMYRVTHQVVLQVLLTSKGKLYFSIRSTYYNSTFVFMSTQPREHVSPFTCTRTKTLPERQQRFPLVNLQTRDRSPRRGGGEQREGKSGERRAPLGTGRGGRGQTRWRCWQSRRSSRQTDRKDTHWHVFVSPRHGSRENVDRTTQYVCSGCTTLTNREGREGEIRECAPLSLSLSLSLSRPPRASRASLNQSLCATPPCGVCPVPIP